MIGGNPLGLSLEVDDQAMAQRRLGHGGNVVKADIETPFRQGTNLGPEQQSLSAARAASKSKKLVGDIEGRIGCRVGGQDQAHSVVLYV